MNPLLAVKAAKIAMPLAGGLAKGAESRQALGDALIGGLAHVSLNRFRDQSRKIATQAAEAKKQAKKIHGNSLFLDRRQAPAPRPDVL